MGLGYIMMPSIQIKISTITVMKENIAKFGFSSCTYMAIPTSCVCSCIRPVKPLNTEMCRTLSGSSLSLWPFRKGYRVFAGFFPTKRDHLGGIYSLEFFLKLLQFLICFFFFFSHRRQSVDFCLTSTHLPHQICRKNSSMGR